MKPKHWSTVQTIWMGLAFVAIGWSAAMFVGANIALGGVDYMSNPAEVNETLNALGGGFETMMLAGLGVFVACIAGERLIEYGVDWDD